MSLERFRPSSSVSGWINSNERLSYEPLTFVATGTISLSGNGTTNVNAFKTSGAFAWDAQAYCLTPFTAPCTIEFNKWSANLDNLRSYAMIGWNTDPTTNASYDSLDYASYPYRMSLYEVYNGTTQVLASGTWSRLNKFYIVYGTDGFIRHYNGSTQLYSVNYGNATTTNASYDSLDYASYPYAMSNYQVYNGTTNVQNGGTWSRTTKFYIVYGTDGFIRHYNGSTQLYSVNYGNATTTFYIDSSLHSVGATFGGFSNIRAIRRQWNGTSYS